MTIPTPYSFLSVTDFQLAPYNIPNLEYSNAFQTFINKECADLLRDKLLGAQLYDSFVTALNAAAVDGAPALAARWEALLNGSQYLHVGYPYTWKGMKEMLVPYIYSIHLNYDIENYSGAGVVKLKTENAVTLDPRGKISRAWNKFSILAGNQECEWDTTALYEDTLYGFIYNKANDYLQDIAPLYNDMDVYLYDKFKQPGYKNAFNI